MTDYKQEIGKDTFYTVNHLWMLVTEYPKFEEMEHLFKLKQSRIDESRYSYTNSGTQWPLDPDDWAKEQYDFFEWMQSKFDELRLPFEVECVLASWAIDYNLNGFQTAHRHSYEALNPNGGEISCVINFDDTSSRCSGRNPLHSAFWLRFRYFREAEIAAFLQLHLFPLRRSSVFC